MNRLKPIEGTRESLHLLNLLCFEMQSKALYLQQSRRSLGFRKVVCRYTNRESELKLGTYIWPLMRNSGKYKKEVKFRKCGPRHKAMIGIHVQNSQIIRQKNQGLRLPSTPSLDSF